MVVGVCDSRVAGENELLPPTEAVLKPGRWAIKSERSCKDKNIAEQNPSRQIFTSTT